MRQIGNRWQVWLLALLVVLGGFLACRPIWDVDIFWHIAAGRWIIETSSFPSTDIFGFELPPRGWVTFQWLYEVLVAFVDGQAGLVGVRLANGLLHAVAFGLFGLLAWKSMGKSESRGIVAVLLMCLLFALYADRVRVRPHVFNLIGWSALLYLMFCTNATFKLRLLLSAVVMAVWANMHAGGAFVFLLASLCLPVAALTVKLRGEKAGRWISAHTLGRSATLVGIWTVVCVLSPNWLSGVRQAHAMLGGSEMLIDEWLPFWHYFAAASHPLHYLAGLAPLAALALLVAALLRRTEKRLDVMLFCVAAALLPFRSARFVYHEAFVFLLLIPSLLALWPQRLGTGRMRRATGAIIAAVLLLATVHFHGPAQSGSVAGFVASFGEDIDSRRFPVELLEPLEELAGSSAPDAPLKVFCLPNWGGYLLYQLYPRIRVIADGRGNFPEETGVKLHFIYLYRHSPRHAPMVERIYSESGADLLVIQRPAFPAGHEPTGWTPVHREKKGEIWQRR